MSSPRSPIVRAVRRLAERLGPLSTLAIGLAAMTLLFVGCLELSDAPFWRRTPRETAPPAELVVDRLIRVRLLGDNPQPSAKLAVTSSFTVTDAGADRTYGATHPPLAQTTVRPASPGGIEIGDMVIPADDVTLSPARDAALVLNGRTYRGRMRIQRRAHGVIFTNYVDIESYLRGVLRGELPRYFHPESFKAQCVAARTYALYSKLHKPAGPDFDVYDHEGSQMYKGVEMEGPTSDRAVEQTAGEVCIYNDGSADRLFCTYYSSCCGGMSQHVNNVKPNDPDPPPLRGGVACNDCYTATHYRWGPVSITKADLTRRLVARYPSIRRLGEIVALRPKRTTSDGRIIAIELVGSGGGNETLIGEDFRLSAGSRTLKSTRFTIEDGGDRFVFRDGRGFGHGMGLCQFGMDAKARRGMGYRDILTTYFPGAQIKRAY